MDFFEPPPSPEPPEREPPEREPRRPAWIGPPDNVLPGIVAVQLVIARTQDAVVAVSGIRAYPTGLDFTVSVRLRPVSGRDVGWSGAGLFDDPVMLGPQAGGRLREEFLRFGVQLADGRKATNLAHPALPLEEGSEPEPPVLTTAGGGGGEGRWDVDYWLWPLPPAGPLGFVCAWPAHHIPESRVDTDTGPILEAAGRAVTLWPENPGPGPGPGPSGAGG